MTMQPQTTRTTNSTSTPKLTITRGVKTQPEWIVVFGPPGIGKSTLGANAPRPLFLDLESGTAQLDVARVEGIETWDALRATLRALINDGTEGFETLVVDTLDKAEWLCQQKVCAAAGKKSLEDFSFGKGFTAAYEAFRGFISDLHELRVKRGMRCIVLAHAKVGKVPNTAGGPDYERWELKVDKRVGGVFFEAADAVLYAHHDVSVAKREGQRVTGFSDGARLLGTVETPAYMAKNRFGLPPVMPLACGELFDAIARGNSPAMLASSIRARIGRITDATMRERAERGFAAAEAAQNYAKLVEIDSWLAANTSAPPAQTPTTQGEQTTKTPAGE